MFKTKFIISISLFISFLVITSAIKNETRLIEKKISNLKDKVLFKEQDINETQLDFYYLTSPAEIEKKLNLIGFENYQPIEHSKIFHNLISLESIQKKTSDLKKFNEKKIQKK